MISSPCYFVSEYDSDTLYITSAQPLSRQEKTWDNISSNPHSINYFIVSYIPPENQPSSKINNSDNILARRISTLIAVFFGKKIDEHGFIQLAGNFWAPDMAENISNRYFFIAPFSHRPRKDLGDIMVRVINNKPKVDDFPNWDRLSILKPLIDNVMPESHFNDFFFTAGNYYLHSLQSLSKDPQIAYLDLIMCGEILSNYPQLSFSENQLYDKEILNIFEEIAILAEGAKKVRLLKDKMLSIRRRYAMTIMSLLNTYYFQNESNDLPQFMGFVNKYRGVISPQQAEKHIKCSYDLRSKFIHTGFPFGQYVTPFTNSISEIHIGNPIIEGADNDTLKLVKYAAKYVGLERMMRFCLLRFIQKYGGIHIDDRLNDD